MTVKQAKQLRFDFYTCLSSDFDCILSQDELSWGIECSLDVGSGKWRWVICVRGLLRTHIPAGAPHGMPNLLLDPTGVGSHNAMATRFTCYIEAYEGQLLPR